jgi:large subunit ribosomal protein L3
MLKNMLNTILGKKKNMSQAFVGTTRVPVTYVEAGPCIVTQIKNEKIDGYWAVQIGFGEKKIKNVTKPMQGHLRGAIKDKKAPRFLREVRFDKKPDLKVGDEIKISDIFSEGDVITITGTSKGKGFAGVVKRWGFAGGPRTHGQSDRPRSPGSIGQGTTPGRVHKGKKMAGRMGGDTVTVKSIKVISIDAEKNEMTVLGPVPGAPKGLLIIKKVASGKLSDISKETEQVQVEQEVKEESPEKESKE